MVLLVRRENSSRPSSRLIRGTQLFLQPRTEPNDVLQAVNEIQMTMGHLQLGHQGVTPFIASGTCDPSQILKLVWGGDASASAAQVMWQSGVPQSVS